MAKIFFTNDVHFGHGNVIKFDNRPFETVEEMDKELVNRWNTIRCISLGIFFGEPIRRMR